MTDSIKLQRRGITLILDPSAEGPGRTYRHQCPGVTIEVIVTPLARIRYTATLTADVEGRPVRNVSLISARTLEELDQLLREGSESECLMDGLTMLSAKRRAA